MPVYRENQGQEMSCRRRDTLCTVLLCRGLRSGWVVCPAVMTGVRCDAIRSAIWLSILFRPILRLTLQVTENCCLYSPCSAPKYVSVFLISTEQVRCGIIILEESRTGSCYVHFTLYYKYRLVRANPQHFVIS